MSNVNISNEPNTGSGCGFLIGIFLILMCVVLLQGILFPSSSPVDDVGPRNGETGQQYLDRKNNERNYDRIHERQKRDLRNALREAGMLKE